MRPLTTALLVILDLIPEILNFAGEMPDFPDAQSGGTPNNDCLK